MAENEKNYLQECLQKNICPTCQKTLYNKVGSGKLNEGTFCSLDCNAKWHEASLIRRHQARLKKKE